MNHLASNSQTDTSKFSLNKNFNFTFTFTRKCSSAGFIVYFCHFGKPLTSKFKFVTEIAGACKVSITLCATEETNRSFSFATQAFLVWYPCVCRFDVQIRQKRYTVIASPLYHLLQYIGARYTLPSKYICTVLHTRFVSDPKTNV